MATSDDSGHDPCAAPAHAVDGAGGPATDGPPPARRGLGAVGRTVLLAVGVVAAFLVGLSAVALLGGAEEDDAAAGRGEADPTDAVQAPGLGNGGEPPAELPQDTLEGFADAEPVDLATYVGEPLVVNFWATWCPPCVEEMPELQAVHNELGDAVTFLGVNVNDAPSNAEAFVDELDVGYDLAVDADGEYYRDVGSVGMPTTLAVDRDGRIVGRHAGPLSAEELRAWIGEHLGVSP